MLRCIAIDDEPLALNVFSLFCEKLPYIELKQTFTQTSKAKHYLKKQPVDLIFLDIQMPDINGIDFYKALKKDVMVIFTTAYAQYAVEGFNVNAVDYVLKPLIFERFKIACDKAKEYYEFLINSGNESKQCIYVRSEYSLFKIPFSEIVYMETMDEYIKVHRSFIIPFNKIENIRAKIIMINNIEVPIGISYEKEVLKRYLKR